VASDTQSPFRRFLQRVYRDAAQVLGRTGETLTFTVRNVTAMFAIAVALLYAIGIVQRLGVLHKEGVPFSRALSLTNFQDYFVAGLADVATPKTLADILEVTIFIPLLLLSPYLRRVFNEVSAGQEGVAATPSVDDADSGDTGVSTIVLVAFFFLAMLGGAGLIIDGLLFVPVAIWGPTVAAAIPAVVMWVLVRYRVIEVHSWKEWGHPHARIVAITVAAMLIVFVLAKAWAVPAPLDTVRIRTVDEVIKPSKLLGSTNAFVYILVSGPNEATIIRAIPIGRITSMSVEDGRPRAYATVPQLFHLDVGPFERRFGGRLHVSVCKYLRIPKWVACE
jgi:hypothetical protein